MRSYALNDDGVVSSKPGAPGWKRLLLAGAIVIATLAVVGGVLALPASSNGILAVVALIAFGVPALWLVWRAPVLCLIALIFLNASFLPASALDVRVEF